MIPFTTYLTAAQDLRETLDAPHEYGTIPYQSWQWMTRTQTLWKAHFPGYELTLERDTTSTPWQVSFRKLTAMNTPPRVPPQTNQQRAAQIRATGAIPPRPEPPESTLGAGSAFQVFSNVAAILKDFIIGVNPKAIQFSSALDQPSRIKLYQRLMDRVSEFAPGYVGRRLPPGKIPSRSNAKFGPRADFEITKMPG